MKNHRGLLLPEETLKVILAVICIGFLAILIYSLLNGRKNAEELGFAVESVDFLVQGINTSQTSVDIHNPKGWVILSWPYQDEGKIPKSCSNLGWTDCICITKDVNAASQAVSLLPFTDSVRDKFLENSDSDGSCVENSKQFVVRKDGTQQQPIVIEPPLKLNIDYTTKTISKA